MDGGRESSQRRSDEPAVTVVMITRDRREDALRSVGQLGELPDAPPIVVVDNGSSDGTVAALSRRPGVSVIAARENLGAAGRNLGAEQAHTRYVAFADDDSWWAPDALPTAARLLDEHPRLGGLVARTLVGATERDDPLNELLAAAPVGRDADLPGPTALGFLACASIVRRQAFLDVGGFHRRYGGGGGGPPLAPHPLAARRPFAYLPPPIPPPPPANRGRAPPRPAP